MIVSLTVRCELFGISRDVNQVQHDTLIPCVKGKQGVANIQIGGAMPVFKLTIPARKSQSEILERSGHAFKRLFFTDNSDAHDQSKIWETRNS